MRLISPLFLILSVILTAIGFNTIDAMVNTFAWSEPTNGLWHMSTFLVLDFWSAYALFGILPFAIGTFLLGFVVRSIYASEQKR